MWGTLNFSLSNKLYKRITPTCVGNTKPLTCVACPFEDHPHLCGEHTSFFRQRTIHKGSPPPVWGTLFLDGFNPIVVGITPTCVGNTCRPSTRAANSKDHPHLCGEHRERNCKLFEKLGSPPPVWGTHGSQQTDNHLVGITPTCVGNTRPGHSTY